MIRKLCALALCLILCASADGARDFDGTDDFLRVDTAAVTGPPFTVSAWANFDVSNRAIWSLNNKAEDDEKFKSLIPTSASDVHRFAVQSNAVGNRNAETSTGATVGTWHHFAAVAASTTDRRCFIDGGSKGTNTQSISPLGIDRTSIGQDGDADGIQFFNGRIAHVAIWNVALTDQEVASLAAGVSPLRMRRDALIAYWPVGGQSPELDIVGGLSMTVNSAPAQAEEPPIPYAIVAPGS